MSSVSLRNKNAPNSNIHLIEGRPTEVPHAFRSVCMNFEFGKGFGAARFIGPSNS